MNNYSKEELEALVEWQNERIGELSDEVVYLNEILDAYVIADARVEQAYNELFPLDTAEDETLEYRLKKRAEIRRQITTRKSVQEGAPDRISDLLEEAAAFIATVREKM